MLSTVDEEIGSVSWLGDVRRRDPGQRRRGESSSRRDPPARPGLVAGWHRRAGRRGRHRYQRRVSGSRAAAGIQALAAGACRPGLLRERAGGPTSNRQGDFRDIVVLMKFLSRVWNGRWVSARQPGLVPVSSALSGGGRHERSAKSVIDVRARHFQRRSGQWQPGVIFGRAAGDRDRVRGISAVSSAIWRVVRACQAIVPPTIAFISTSRRCRYPTSLAASRLSSWLSAGAALCNGAWTGGSRWDSVTGAALVDEEAVGNHAFR